MVCTSELSARERNARRAHFREAEVEHFRLATLGDEDVERLEIAMGDMC